MELQFRTDEFAASVFTQIKTTEWIVSRLGHVVTTQALGENIKYRNFPLKKETNLNRDGLLDLNFSCFPQ